MTVEKALKVRSETANKTNEERVERSNIVAQQHFWLDRQVSGAVPDCHGDSVNRRPLLMTLNSHLVELERRHQALEKQIEDAVNHPASDDLTIAAMKKRKLQLKDEISRLSSERMH